MAKKKVEEGPNKSARIRNYMEANPKAGPKEVSDALKAEGLDVSAAYVSTVKALDKKSSKKKSGGAARGPARAAASGSGDMLASLLQAKKLADAMGGVANAKAALDALAKLGL